METIKNAVHSIIMTAGLIRVADIFDILILSVLFYQLMKLSRESRASQVLKGLVILLIASLVAQWLNLRGTGWLFSYIVNTGPLMILILFQPEIRRAFEKVGRGKIFALPATEFDYHADAREIMRAAMNMAKRKVGAFIVIKGKTGLREILESGTMLEAKVSSALLENIFEPGTPLHDGAAIVIGNRIAAAGCFCNTTSRTDLPQTLGARHRAAIGVTENTDAIAIVVSEETGNISAASNGELTTNLDLRGLRSFLMEAYSRAGVASETRGLRGMFGKARKKEGTEDDQF